MTDLPNDLWVRSPLKPEWAICLDPKSVHFGYKMQDTALGWILGSKLTKEELKKALNKKGLEAYKPIFESMLEYD